MWKTARSFASSVARNPRLTRFVLQSPKQVELEFDDGKKFIMSAEFLRVQSPAADSKIRTVKGEKIISGRRYVGIMSAETVGNYGIRNLHMGLLIQSRKQ
ncbi:hypothetical protein SUGI_0096960 [Cryptomeria japonica]|uniref:uncharacterized protein LOC131062498 isoform X2 n=1 Tax=Cryptomeria japonica TaxID=3369 RepID=UPI002408B90A|nr:uncharacterized protein LOC131062498 isoform X2 [Cryptomeria japonica]GLJ08843.1 hypothetical protein SUGI_0096960 [Cryptomeria japonica]